jgi:hypothetical protein
MFSKKLLLISLIIPLSLIAVNFTFASFSDVPSSHPNSEAINYVQTQKIVEGYADGTYKPDQLINRAEFTKIIIGTQFPTSEIHTCVENNHTNWQYVFFPDVSSNAWYAPYICTSKINNIIQGYPEGTFRPANNISFVEAAKIIVIAFGYVVSDPDNLINTEAWYKPYVQVLANKNAIPSFLTDFSQTITRGEMAEMIWRLKENITDQASANLPGITVSNPAAENDAIYDSEIWAEYTNDKLGISFMYPKKSQITECTRDPQTSLYQLSESSVGVGPIESSNTVYLSPIHHYDFGDPQQVTVNGEGVTRYATCEKVLHYLAYLQELEFGPWQIKVRTVNDEDELLQFVQEQYASGCTIASQIESDQQPGVFDIELNTTSPDEPEESSCFINWGHVIKYSPDQKKAVQWDLGQDASFFSPSGTAYDQQIIDSFRFEPQTMITPN